MIIIVSLLAPFSIIGFVYLYRAQKLKKEEQALGAALDRMMKKHKLSIELTESFNRRALGIDRKNRKLVWIDHSNDNKQEICFSLLGIMTCIIDNKNDDTNSKIEKVNMIIHHKRSTIPSVLSFFDGAHDRVQEFSNVLKKARQWKNKIDTYKYPGNIHIEQEFVL